MKKEKKMKEENKLERILELHRSLLWRCQDGQVNVSAKKIEEETRELEKLCGVGE